MVMNNTIVFVLGLPVSLTKTIILVLTLTLLWKVILVLWVRPKRIERGLRKNGLKGSGYYHPLGDLLLYINLHKNAWSKPISLSDDTLPRVNPFACHILQKYGNNSFGWLGTHPWLIVTDPDKAKEIMARYEDFQKPDLKLSKMILVGLFSHEGEKWAKHRKIINPAFHLEKLKIMLPAMFVSCQTMTDLLMQEVSEAGSCELDIAPYLENLTSDVISRTAFGSSYEEGRKIFELQKEHVFLVQLLAFANYLPGWSFLPTKTNQRVKAVKNEMDEVLTSIIENKIAELEAGGSTENNLLGLLLESNFKEIKDQGNEKGRGMTTQEVVEECRLFYLAGAESTSSFLAYTMVLLSEHQDWQEKARTEILHVFTKDGKPNFEGLSQLKVVSMILYEVLRLYTPGFMVLREVYKDTNLGEWFIPAGTQVVIPLSNLHQDCDTWGNDAKEFNPERFSQGVSKAMKTQGIFMPFSGGPRVCVGQNFALLEAKMAVTMILQRFSLHLAPTYAHAPQATVTTKPQYGVNLILSKI